ncbi:hypothetical protein [Kitasatospora sp. McL0602]|uniref:hypothetical protein n=1 Tax=Kitasatospora sp. McL0602 TaxID=3439530 RepID=UPI003F8B6956
MRLDGIEAVTEVVGIEEVAMEPEVDGDYFANGSNRDRVVHVIAVADDADLAHAAADEALGRLTVEWADIEGELRYP